VRRQSSPKQQFSEKKGGEERPPALVTSNQRS
jgi:hypothetical protein